MNTDLQLKTELNRINHRGYPAYKDLKGSYQFPGYVLHIEHVQGDPFAAPSKVCVEVPMKVAGFPAGLFDKPFKRIALEDLLIRKFGRCMSGFCFSAKGSGKSGLMSISRPGQQVLERTACNMNDRRIIVRFEIGFPANGRTINSPELEKILFRFVPECVKRALYYRSLDAREIKRVIDLAEDQEFIRQKLTEENLAAFVANGSILPRESGVSDKPMNGAVVFESPKSMEVCLKLPHRGETYGMGIPRGITLIVGGGYHGKSTLLSALEVGVYNHIAGDGREYVVTDNTAVKIRAEDGRAITHVNISPFINHLPNGKDTVDFTTEDASGSTSQAANVVEAVQAGAKVFLIDEDTSATNFMVRDALMQAVIAKDKEPITPFIDRARNLFRFEGVSTILVAGSSGAYFGIADKILQMDTYRALDITETVRKVCAGYDVSEPLAPKDSTDADIIDTDVWHSDNRILVPHRMERKHDQIKIRQFGKDSFSIGRDNVDLKYVEQIVDGEQTAALSHILRAVIEQLERNPKSGIDQVLDAYIRKVEKDGPGVICRGMISGNLAAVRRQEIYACINRFRGWR